MPFFILLALVAVVLAVWAPIVLWRFRKVSAIGCGLMLLSFVVGILGFATLLTGPQTWFLVEAVALLLGMVGAALTLAGINWLTPAERTAREARERVAEANAARAREARAQRDAANRAYAERLIPPGSDPSEVRRLGFDQLRIVGGFHPDPRIREAASFELIARLEAFFSGRAYPQGEQQYGAGQIPGSGGGGWNGRVARSDLPDYYEVLGVDRTASTEEIQKAYRAAAKRSHPDHGGSVEAMQQVNEARDILADPGRRHRYDRMMGF